MREREILAKRVLRTGNFLDDIVVGDLPGDRLLGDRLLGDRLLGDLLLGDRLLGDLLLGDFLLGESLDGLFFGTLLLVLVVDLLTL
jgi:hypothetical protein